MQLQKKFKKYSLEIMSFFTLPMIIVILLGTAILSFGIYNIHEPSNVTEGGVLGLILLINHWFGISPSIISPLLDIVCYVLAYRFLGKKFIAISMVSSLTLAGLFRLWEYTGPILPNFSSSPLIAAILGGLFVGFGVGLIVRQGGSSGGDDALALSISKVTGCRISKAYLATDLSVLILSLSYIPLGRIAFSLVTVFISSYLIDFVEKVDLSGIKSFLSKAITEQR